MKRWVNSAILAIVGSCVLAPSASAQPLPGALGQTGRPAFSPYLNLTRPGGTPALNYFGMVQPQTQFRQAFQNLQGAVNYNQQAIGNVQNQPGELPATGHGFGFMNYNGYFMNTGVNTNQMGMNRGNMRFNNQMFRTPSPGATGAIPGGGTGGYRGPDVRR